jgi:Glycosyl transferase family 2
MLFSVLAVLALLASLLPAGLYWQNRLLYRRASDLTSGSDNIRSVSLLIPARNEAAGIADSVNAALLSQHINLEVVVLDDHSTDGTAEIVSRLSQRDPRVRLESAPPLPDGWCGKQHACFVLASLAKFEYLVFIDADVRLQPTGLVRAVEFLEVSRASLVSGVPRQITIGLLEQLLIPLIHFVLLGFLPIKSMRESTMPAYGAGCGQLFVTTKAAYQKMGGHAEIRESLHDGVRLPRAYRKAGLMTDLFDATDSASCRMYRTSAEVWRGLSKNATEGLASPAMIGPATFLLLFGQVLPTGLVLYVVALTVIGTVSALPLWSIGAALTACVLSYWPRLAAAFDYQQSWLGALLHPIGVLLFLVIQWSALLRKLLGRPAKWKDRAYVAVGPTN